MEYTDFSLEVFKTTIFGQYIHPTEAKSVTILVHGFGEHSGRYKAHVIPALLEIGSAVVVYDNIGHGRSGGKRGHCPGYGSLLDLLDLIIEKAIERYPNVPIFLYGHSMGGNLVLNYAIRKKNNLKAVITTSPYLRLAFQPPAWKMILGKLMLRILPSITLSSGLDPRGISRIPAEVEKYIQDPMVHDKVSPMYSLPVMEAGSWAIENADKLKVPALLTHGTSDPIIAPEGTIEFHENAGITTLKLFKEGYHELHNDLCSKELLTTVQNWLQQQV